MSCAPQSPEPPRPGRARLAKRDVEALMKSYDDDPVASLAVALTRIGAPATLIGSLESMTTSERDRLAKDLIEWRGLGPPGEPGVNY